MRSHWIWLSLLPKLTAAQKLRLIEFFGGPENVYNADARTLRTAGFLTPAMIEVLLDKSMDGVRQVLSECEIHSIGFVTISDSGYPARLRGIADPPLVLYYRGQLPDFEQRPMVGVVGTRHPSPKGSTAAKRLGGEIAACGGMVVSGGALGVDTQALEGAKATGRATVTVLAGGLNWLYPKENESLFTQLCEHGCLVSELPPGSVVHKGSFLQRNRLISGMSNCVLVVEAPYKSGALNTAHWAREQGRELFAVPGTTDEPGNIGSNALLADGARSVSSGWDILKLYAPRFPHSVRQNTFVLPEEPPLKIQNDKKDIDKTQSGAYSVIEKKLPPLTQREQVLVDRLKDGPVLCHFLAAEAGADTGEIMRLLTTLSLKGVVETDPEGMVYLK